MSLESSTPCRMRMWIRRRNEPLSTRRLLVIDDESDIREVATLTLELTEGWTVLTAGGGKAGAALAALATPDAILLDVMMPDMDGPDTFRAIAGQDASKRIPVIFLTAKAQATNHQALMDMGVRGVIVKPFDPLTLGKRIREILHWE